MKKRAVLAGLVLAATIAGWLSHSDALPLATQESKAASAAQEWSWFLPGSPIVESPERGGDVRGNLVAMAYLPILTREGQWVEVVHRGRRGWIDTAREPPHDRDNARRGGLRARAERVRGNDPWKLKAAKDLLGERASEMKVGSYRLFTDVQDQELLSYLDGAATAAEEAYFARYGRLPSGNPLRSAVLFANEATYRRYTDEEDIQLPGTSTGSAGSGVLVFYAEGKQRADLAATLVHEITHLLNDRALATNLPPWLEEGLASDLGSLWVEVFPRPGEGASVSDRVSVAIQRFERSVLALNASLMAGQLPPLSTLLTLDRQGFYAEETSGDSYAQSLALIRYLLDEKEGLAEGFRAFLGRIASGRPTDLLELVELDGREMELGFRHWLQGAASAAIARFAAEYPGTEISVMEGGGLRLSGSGLPPPPRPAQHPLPPLIQEARPANQQAGEPPEPEPDTPLHPELSVSFRVISPGPGSVIVEPVRIHNVEPIYPDAADSPRPDRFSAVIVTGTVDKSGEVIKISMMRGFEPALDASLIDAVSQWRFTCGTVNGEPAVFHMTVILTFESDPSRREGEESWQPQCL